MARRSARASRAKCWPTRACRRLILAPEVIPALLDVDGLFVRYGILIGLRDASLTVGKGEFVALVGANGAGKSSLLSAVAGLVGRSEGRITFDGQDITRRRTDEIVRAGISLCPEGRGILPRMSVRENLLLGAYHQRAQAARNLERVHTLFPILHERHGQMAGTLSGGQQQMLSIGRALMSEPRLLMLDEPSLGLAPIVVHEILETVAALAKDGMTILLSEESAKKALEFADRAYVLETGNIVLEDTASALLGDEALTAAYLGRSHLASHDSAEA
ncbi:MAG: ABC transporter ATP-binding protein [Rhodospirillaceae bacterium]|nr:ABC transporter ATP-binding protein [Rhodospirillaceae bacterium]MBT3925751.1 ABC transporter ATP-binding protein [Rhodospirillaceae bacterium]MBT5781123.1 ABC transporter ATP-binding protein [Rhodospirillaceae bacterium]